MSNSGKKFDFQGVLNNIKSMISPESNTPSPDPSDAIGMKIAELSVLAQQLTKSHEEQAKELANVNRLLNDLFKDLEAFRNPPENKTEEKQEDKKEETKKD
ncbi:hypothetical protein [Coxiella burnetii]|uniref:Uncharacterized protein n=1 Tax=Coxiella burnetii (strain Dugway 5J108-111) TaxID=434922 RepID=A9KCV8_COXBN|nr:hypothetical protein [Coxiella burnetii]ABS78188.1 hypothetical protein CBUD_1565 [Coxiella burnetii Dugway 5J108-111]ABX78756.1 hypothetical protein COXBURSA331_A0622 [Coxiella burnetii RSA 331]ACJ18796.1 hypothetical protein CbuG_1502 [Coxiella burnetii CbuG_Q212]ATN67169.1 hypothetical protein AYM17_07350 [Coxiella burnetii]ATN73981.1 hypothetical protein AYM90_02545 [Coxiella burnetii]